MSLTDIDFEYIRHFIRDAAAIALDGDKRYLVESRLAPIVREGEFSSLQALIRELRRKPFGQLHRDVVEAMTTNETSFFRDIHPFAALQAHVLPELMARRTGERRIRIWCAACSSGQEPHTIALVIHEHFPELANWTLEILGTDISTRMVKRSREGIYTQLEVNRGLPAPMLVRYFEKMGAEWRLKENIRKKAVFETHNLAVGFPPAGSWDIVFLRNVLIYFDTDTKRSVLAKVRRALRPDGYLFLGGAETTLNLDDEFERSPFARAGCYRLRADRSVNAVCNA